MSEYTWLLPVQQVYLVKWLVSVYSVCLLKTAAKKAFNMFFRFYDFKLRLSKIRDLFKAAGILLTVVIKRHLQKSLFLNQYMSYCISQKPHYKKITFHCFAPFPANEWCGLCLHLCVQVLQDCDKRRANPWELYLCSSQEWNDSSLPHIESQWEEEAGGRKP